MDAEESEVILLCHSEIKSQGLEDFRRFRTWVCSKKDTEVFAYYASPATIGAEATSGKSYPGVVLVHGGGGTAFRVWVLEWARRGYAALAMDLAGSRPAPMKEQKHPWGAKSYRLPNGGPGQGNDYKFFNIDEPFTDQWPYHAVANIIRGHSLLRSLPKVKACRQKNGRITAKIQSGNDLKSAHLAYTVEDKPNQDRKWEMIPAEIDGRKVSAFIPQKARLYYLFVTDERGMRVSGPVLSR